jgi:hypothetical protein
MFRFTCGPYTISLADSLPPTYYSYSQRARLVETFELEGELGSLCYLSVARGHHWPFLMVAQRYNPGPQSGFYPGVLYIPETQILFLGTGSRLLAYTLEQPARIWENHLTGGFWQWERLHDRVIMSCENGLVVWDTDAQKRWTYFVEPPWHYSVDGDIISVHFDGRQTELNCERGVVIEGTTVQDLLMGRE